MKKIFILLAAVALCWSCVEDRSAYLPQEKEDVVVDETPPYDPGEDPVMPEDYLKRGMNEITIDVLHDDGQVLPRRFKYYLPPSIDVTKPVSLVFEFHGSWTYPAGTIPPDPISDINENHVWNSVASKENCIIVYPAGDVGVNSIFWGGEAVPGGRAYARSLPFVDAMLEFFSAKTPRYDENRVYTTGQSSGAIFSYNLAYYRSDKFAAAVPRAGQMALRNNADPVPTTVVPIRAFNGTLDIDIVNYQAAMENFVVWSEIVGGYFSKDAVNLEPIVVDNYHNLAPRVWRGGSADLEFYSIVGESHGVDLPYVIDYVWEFMGGHVRNQEVEAPLFINASVTEIALDERKSATFGVSYSHGAKLTHNIPAALNPAVHGNTITITAPNDFFTSGQYHNLDIVITATRGTESKSYTIKYTMNAPKTYLEVGDIYYVNNTPIGVVVWVDQSNIRRGKIVSLATPNATDNSYYNGNGSGMLGIDFLTPSTTDGAGNTAAMIARNEELGNPNTVNNSLWVWAASLSVEGMTGWYLPAIDEMAEVLKNYEKINDALLAVSDKPFHARNDMDKYYTSTVTIRKGVKEYHWVSFYSGAVGTQLDSRGTEYFGWIYGRAFLSVTK